jgi:putative endonuclease
VEKVYCVYILTNQRDTVLYTGVTGDLRARVQQHREKLLPGFTNRYNVSKLVYYEVAGDAPGAIAREKQIKAGSRRKKIQLINQLNPRVAGLIRRPVTRIEIASSLRSSQ